MSFNVTLIAFLAAIAVAGFANVMARRPVEPGKIRLLPYHGIQFVGIVAALALAAHLVSLIAGKPLEGRFAF